ncbi:MAG: hypothetical protein ACI85I_001115 [Arenicella sp.]|jgi:hypothetical protein
MTLADILNLLNRLPSINLQLDNPSSIEDMTWFSVSESRDNLKVVYIFRSKEDELLVARNGKVSDGKWDFIPNTNSVFIRFMEEKVLHNALLLKGHYLVLRQDGSEKVMLLVNQAYYQKILETAPKKVWDFIHKDIKLFVPEVEELDFTLDSPKVEEESEADIPEEVKATIDMLSKQIEIKETKKEATQVPRKIVEDETHEEVVEQIPEPKEEVMEEEKVEEKPEGKSLIDRFKEANPHKNPKQYFDHTPSPSLNDKLKESMKKEKQPSLLEKLAEQRKNKE